MSVPEPIDPEIAAVEMELRSLDPDGTKTARVLRDTIDQLYDGQRTGRYKWEQLYKTEKTHCGTLVEINLQREFKFADGEEMDFRIADIEVDCKYSQKNGGWMIPPEAHGHICMLLWAKDSATPVWSLGLVRISPDVLNTGGNRDAKLTLNTAGRSSIRWLWDRASLPPNVLLQLDNDIVEKIMSLKHGTQRTNELFRQALGMIVGRSVVATVAQQDDYMKRVRENGGARSSLKPEGVVVLGQYKSHAIIATALGIPVPGPGDSISVRLAPAQAPGPGVAEIGGSYWQIAGSDDPIVPAPDLPKIHNSTKL